MAENGDPDIHLGAVTDFLSDFISNSSQAQRVAAFGTFEDRHLSAEWFGPLGDDHNRKATSLLVAGQDLLADQIGLERDLRDQDDMGSSRNPRVQRDPADIAPHHFDHDHPMMAFGGGMKLVERFAGGVDRGLKSKGHIGGRNIIIDGLWNPNGG